MAKKNITSTQATTDSAETVSETPVSAPVATTIKTVVMIGGVATEVEIPVEQATGLLETLKDSPEVKAQKDAARKASLSAKLKAKREEEKAKLANDPEWLKKQEEKQAKREANAAVKAKRDAARARREERKTNEKNENEAILAESGSSLPIDRLKIATIVKKFNRGEKNNDAAHRGWEAKLVYVNQRGMDVKQNFVVDLDVEGVGTLQTAYDKARATLLEMLADAK